jgi:hypothetical protein
VGPEADSLEPSKPKDSFATSARGLALLFLGAAAFFAFFGGVLERTEPSPNLSLPPSDISSSESFFARCFLAVALDAGFDFRVVCVNFLAPDLPAAGFEALALGF